MTLSSVSGARKTSSILLSQTGELQTHKPVAQEVESLSESLAGSEAYDATTNQDTVIQLPSAISEENGQNFSPSVGEVSPENSENPVGASSSAFQSDYRGVKVSFLFAGAVFSLTAAGVLLSGVPANAPSNDAGRQVPAPMAALCLTCGVILCAWASHLCRSSH